MKITIAIQKNTSDDERPFYEGFFTYDIEEGDVELTVEGDKMHIQIKDNVPGPMPSMPGGLPRKMPGKQKPTGPV